MKAHTASFLNALVLIIMGGWGYFEGGSHTALIPVFFGVLLLVFNNGIRNENKIQAHIAVVLTLLVAVALLAKPLPAAIERGETLSIIRIGLMVLTSLIALYSFVMNFIKASKAKKQRNS